MAPKKKGLGMGLDGLLAGPSKSKEESKATKEKKTDTSEKSVEKEISAKAAETKEPAGPTMLNITMLLSVNLGILNLLPFPALDGGRLVFLLIEVVRGKPIPPEKEGIVHFVGLMFFMILMVFIFFNDLVNIFG